MFSLDMFSSLSTETRLFMATIFVFALVFHASYTHQTAEKAPAFLTTLGILGTFIGIALGLRNFDTEDIQRSVPALIDGIKTAVWASALGIFCALTIKLRDIEGFYKKKKPAQKAATVEELISALRAVEKALLTHGTSHGASVNMGQAQALASSLEAASGSGLTLVREAEAKGVEQAALQEAVAVADMKPEASLVSIEAALADEHMNKTANVFEALAEPPVIEEKIALAEAMKLGVEPPLEAPQQIVEPEEVPADLPPPTKPRRAPTAKPSGDEAVF